MRILIDIPESIYDTIQDDQMISREQLAVLQMHILNGIPIPDNATNGDVIKAMTNFIGVQDEEDTIKISTNWWNSPYQKGGK